jgi:hypothetical protein
MEIQNTEFMHKMVRDFYNFMADVYIEFQSQTEKRMVPIKPIVQATGSTATTDATATTGEEVVETRQQTFQEYFLFKLYYNYGIRRRMVNEHIALLFYAKNLKGYKPKETITMLCRHMMLDMRNMRIISLGIPKAMKLEDFVNEYNINMDDSSTNFVNVYNPGVENDLSKSPKHRIYKFPEGTMITYNPSLKKFNVDMANVSINDDDDDNDNNDNNEEGEKEVKENLEAIQQNLDTQFTQLFQYSTRKVVGTGRFSSTKTFMEMFNENNTIANTNLDNIPDDIMNNKVLVFNIEHPENRIISTQARNFNTLCCVFEFKTEELATEQYITVMNIAPENTEAIRSGFQALGNNMITQMHVSTFKKLVLEYDVNLHLPEVIKSFEVKNGDGKAETINAEELSFNQLVNIVNNRPKDFQGYIIYGMSGERTKIMNNKYKELKILKGNKPIVLEQWNTKNLFYLYWRLMKLQLIPQFITEFDETGGWSYNQLFYWFASVARGYAINLFKVYHNSFVKKTFDKHNIPYSMKPLCGDLHSMYRNNKMPISPTMVEQYIFEQPAGKVFWRLFSGK